MPNNKAVLLSVRPEWCKKILSGEKTVEVRRTCPVHGTPFKVYIYCTLAGSDNLFMDVLNRDVAAWNRGGWPEKKGRVIGEFTCDKIDKPIKVKARVRYSQPEKDAIVEQIDDNTLHIVFDEPQRAISKGQAAVLYDGEYVVGGGTII